MDPLSCCGLLLLLLCINSGSGSERHILPEGPVDVLLGGTAVLTTVLQGETPLVVIWNKNDGSDTTNVVTMTSEGTKVNEPYADRVTINKTTGAMTLTGVTADDSGDYSISMITAGSTLAGEIKIRVMEKVTDVTVKSDLPEAIEHNSTVTLTCSSKGSYLTFTWLNGSAPLKADGTHITLKPPEEKSSQVVFKDVLRYDLVGPIYCMAANKMGSDKSTPFNLTVYYGPDAVTLSPPAPPKFLRSGSSFNLTCSAISKPPATFSWFHDQKKLEATGNLLTLETIQKLGLGKNATQFSCMAENTKTKRYGSSSGVTFTVMDAILGTKVSGPSGVLMAGNSSANLSCQATAGTAYTTEWLKDGKALSGGGRVTLATDKSSVLIKPLMKEDNGVFTCRLGNPINTDSGTYKMTVTYGPEPVQITGEAAVEVNDQVTLVCAAASVPPANYTWRFNGSLTEVKSDRFFIEMAKYKNSGTYTCEAKNQVTGKTSSSTHTLSVKEEGALDDGLSDGAIAGIVIGVIAALAAAIGLVIYCRQKVPVESPY